MLQRIDSIHRPAPRGASSLEPSDRDAGFRSRSTQPKSTKPSSADPVGVFSRVSSPASRRMRRAPLRAGRHAQMSTWFLRPSRPATRQRRSSVAPSVPLRTQRRPTRARANERNRCATGTAGQHSHCQGTASRRTFTRTLGSIRSSVGLRCRDVAHEITD
jgi:hypothetical protein